MALASIASIEEHILATFSTFSINSNILNLWHYIAIIFKDPHGLPREVEVAWVFI